jgi:hypothetical protein
MSYKYSTVSEFLQDSNEERHIDRSDVRPSVLGVEVWHAIVSFPGCLGDSHSVARNRDVALSSVEYWLDDSEDSNEFSARYVRGQLRRNGVCYLRDGRVITLNKHTISELF